MTADTELNHMGKGSLPGQDVKKARGMDKHTSHEQNEPGTDQLVEDAKREREGQQQENSKDN